MLFQPRFLFSNQSLPSSPFAAINRGPKSGGHGNKAAGEIRDSNRGHGSGEGDSKVNRRRRDGT